MASFILGCHILTTRDQQTPFAIALHLYVRLLRVQSHLDLCPRKVRNFSRTYVTGTWPFCRPLGHRLWLGLGCSRSFLVFMAFFGVATASFSAAFAACNSKVSLWDLPFLDNNSCFLAGLCFKPLLLPLALFLLLSGLLSMFRNPWESKDISDKVSSSALLQTSAGMSCDLSFSIFSVELALFQASPGHTPGSNASSSSITLCFLGVAFFSAELLFQNRISTAGSGWTELQIDLPFWLPKGHACSRCHCESHNVSANYFWAAKARLPLCAMATNFSTTTDTAASLVNLLLASFSGDCNHPNQKLSAHTIPQLFQRHGPRHLGLPGWCSFFEHLLFHHQWSWHYCKPLCHQLWNVFFCKPLVQCQRWLWLYCKPLLPGFAV